MFNHSFRRCWQILSANARKKCNCNSSLFSIILKNQFIYPIGFPLRKRDEQILPKYQIKKTWVDKKNESAT